MRKSLKLNICIYFKRLGSDRKEPPYAILELGSVVLKLGFGGLCTGLYDFETGLRSFVQKFWSLVFLKTAEHMCKLVFEVFVLKSSE